MPLVCQSPGDGFPVFEQGDPQRDSRLLAHPALDGPRTVQTLRALLTVVAPPLVDVLASRCRTVQTLRSLRVIARETDCQLNSPPGTNNRGSLPLALQGDDAERLHG